MGKGQFLKGVDGLTYDLAVERFKTIIQEEAIRLDGLLKGIPLSSFDRKKLTQMENRELPDKELPDSLKFLSRVLYTCFGQKVILLIDEYDVPLDKAFQHGYYEEMVSFIRGLFGQALKTNEFLKFAVLTGCLRISKESIFTGLNNFKILSIQDVRFDEHFGFTEPEAARLLAGEAVEKTVRLDLTYNELDASPGNLWSVLFTTGYLTQDGRRGLSAGDSQPGSAGGLSLADKGVVSEYNARRYCKD